MKINEILKESYMDDVAEARSKAKKDDFDDWDDEPVVDADQDKVKHLVVQLRTALDFDGDYAISFKDGSKAKLSVDDINLFLKKYQSVKPADREKMQTIASESKDKFMKVVQLFKGEAMPKSKYDSMTHDRSGGPTIYI